MRTVSTNSSIRCRKYWRARARPPSPRLWSPDGTGTLGLFPELRTRLSRTQQRTSGRGRASALPGVTSSASLTSFDGLTHHERPHVALALLNEAYTAKFGVGDDARRLEWAVAYSHSWRSAMAWARGSFPAWRDDRRGKPLRERRRHPGVLTGDDHCRMVPSGVLQLDVAGQQLTAECLG